MRVFKVGGGGEGKSNHKGTGLAHQVPVHSMVAVASLVSVGDQRTDGVGVWRGWEGIDRYLHRHTHTVTLVPSPHQLYDQQNLTANAILKLKIVHMCMRICVCVCACFCLLSM